MKTPIEINVHLKEKIYFILKIFAGIFGYVLLFFAFFGFADSPSKAAFLPLLMYLILILLYLFFRMGFLVGYIKGNAVKVSERQFPEIHKVVLDHCERLEMTQVPDVYILQSGGILNAFATQFMGGNFVVVYSDILEEAYQGNMESVAFVIGHELGHIKRRHITKNILLFPSFFVPFLNRAYSRACEYTCDGIGAALSPQGAAGGLMLLASGKQLWRKMNKQAFIEQQVSEMGFWHWFAEKMASHPHLSKRLTRFRDPLQKQNHDKIVSEQLPSENAERDHSAFLPK